MNELKKEKKSIIIQPRDFKEKLHPQIQKLLNDISNFVFTTPGGLVFNMSNINAKVPIYLDLEEKRQREYRMTWQDLNHLIDELNKIPQLNVGKRGGSMNNKDEGEIMDPANNYRSSLLNKLEKARDNYKTTHPNPLPCAIVTIQTETSLGGYYTRKGKSHYPEIVLLMDTLGNNKNNAKSVAITLVHEMFHAFYDYDLSEKDTDIPYVEEPLTEYAMMKFMEALTKCDNKYRRLLNEARKNVADKKKFSLGICHYGFGSYLWEYEKEWSETLQGIHWMDAFRNVKYKLSEKTCGYSEFAEPFLVGHYPFEHEYYQMELLRTVLLNANGLTCYPQNDELPLGAIIGNNYGQNSWWGEVDDRHAIVLDGDYSSVDTWYNLFDRSFGYLYQIILWDHFKCDSFTFLKEIIKEHAFPRLKLSSHNYGFVQDKSGAILNAAKTALFYCPETAKKCNVPDSVVEILAGAFDNCTALQHVQIPSSVKINSDAFKDCESLEDEIILGDKLLWVPNSKTDYVVTANVTEISKVAFKYCKQLQHLTIPDEIKVVEGLYDDCESLVSEIVLGQKLLWVPNNATEYTIPAGVKEISCGAFKYCKRLQHLTIPSGIGIIPDKAFKDCESLEHEVVFKQKLYCAPKHVKEYDIPNEVTEIDDAAFAHCRCLTRLSIPASMNTVQSSAFGIGGQIRELVFKGNELPKADKRFFYVFGSSCVIWVPKGCKQTFQRHFQSFAVKEYTSENECFKEA